MFEARRSRPRVRRLRNRKTRSNQQSRQSADQTAPLHWQRNPLAGLAIMKLRCAIAVFAAVGCLSAEAQTVSVPVLDQVGAQTVLQAAKQSAQQRNAPSAIAVVDPAGDLLAFERMDGVR